MVKTEDCVACGNCQKYCPIGAIQVYQGMYAKVNPDTCAGCQKCKAACPASIITMQEVSS